MTLDSLEFNWRDKTVHVGIDCRGQGPTILMLPALSSISTRSEMRPLGEQLASIFTTIAIDWPGFGDRPRPSVAWEPDAYRAFLAQILQERNQRPQLQRVMLLATCFAMLPSILALRGGSASSRRPGEGRYLR